MRGHPLIRGHFIRKLSYLPHVKEPVIKGHLSCRESIFDIEVLVTEDCTTPSLPAKTYIIHE